MSDNAEAGALCYRPEIDFSVVSIVLTEECNLRCVYCYQDTRRQRGVMEEATAREAVERALTIDDGSSYVVIELIGGEVTLYWKEVVDLVEWTYANRGRWPKSWSFFMDTNGTLLDDDMKAWLRERSWYVKVGVSLDGARRAHNLNRNNSFDRIAPHIDFFAELWPDQTAKMTISPNTLPFIAEGILSLMARGLQVAANLPVEDIWGPPDEKARHVQVFREEVEKLVAVFADRPELPIPSIVNLPLQIIFSEEVDRPWCGSGRNMSAVDPDGTILPCNRYGRMSFDRKLVDQPIKASTPLCTTCLFKPACQTCEAHNWQVNGNPNARTRFHCEFTKLQVWGTAQIQAGRLRHALSSLAERIGREGASAALTKEILATKVQLANIAEILGLFEEAERTGLPLDQVGAGKRKQPAYVPPLEPDWTQPNMFGAIPGSVADRRSRAQASDRDRPDLPSATPA